MAGNMLLVTAPPVRPVPSPEHVSSHSRCMGCRPCKDTHSVPAGRLHDLTQTDTHTLPLIALLRP